MSHDEREETYSPIREASSLMEYFRQELAEARRIVGLDLDESTEAYLTHLLDGYTRLTPEMAEELGFSKPAALMYGDAIQGAPQRRFEAYRKLGDACLYNCGFFDAKLTTRSVSLSYYQAMGRNAYDHADGLVRTVSGAHSNPFAAIFRELAAKFDGVVASFKRLARAMQGTSASDDLDALLRGMQ